MLGKRTMQATVAKSVTVPRSPISGQDAVYTGHPMHMLCRAWCLRAPPLRRHCMKDWSLANYRVWLHHQTHQKIPSMYGSHFHRLTHLYFQLFYNKLFCTTNFLLCGSISNRTNFWFKKLVQRSSNAHRKIMSQNKNLSREFHLSQFGACLLDDKQCRGKQPKLHPDFVLGEVFDLLLSYIFHLLDPESINLCIQKQISIPNQKALKIYQERTKTTLILEISLAILKTC